MRPYGLPERFLDKTKVITSGCWLWIARVGTDGYGVFTIGSRRDDSRRWVGAHRFALEARLGRPLAAGMDACHNCPGGDNQRCVNPDHLWEGTRLDNMQDSVRKGGQANVEGRARPGTLNGAAKLDEAKVIAIRQATGRQVDIAAKFGVSQPTVSAIKRGALWAHVGSSGK